jgi:hypothetical protein
MANITFDRTDYQLLLLVIIGENRVDRRQLYWISNSSSCTLVTLVSKYPHS